MSEDVAVGTPGSRKRTLAIWAAIGAIALGVAATAIALTMNQVSVDAEQSTPTPTPTVTATPAPAADPTALGELDETTATDVLETALAAPISTVGTEGDLSELLKNVAIDAYAAEVEAQWLELSSQGWTVSGAPALISATVTALDTSTATSTAEVTACLDSSDVIIADYAGDPIGDAAVMTPRALHLFTLQQGDDGLWRISSHSFPNDPKC